MPRALCKGAIAFGLVHISVSLHPAVREHAIHFDWLERRTMKPVGKDDLLALVQRKLEHGETEHVKPPAEERGAEVIDLTALLKRSLDVKHTAAEADGHGKAPTRAALCRKRA